MLNPFPIQFLALFAYLLMRLFVAGTLYYLGVTHIRARTELRNHITLPLLPKRVESIILFAVIEIGIATLLVLGAHTQYAALALMLLCTYMLVFHSRMNHSTIPQRLVYVLLFGMALSLFITGAGVLAFDLPI